MPSRQDAPGAGRHAEAKRAGKQAVKHAPKQAVKHAAKQATGCGRTALAPGGCGPVQAASASSRPASAARGDVARRLVDWVEGEVLPRMMISHGLAAEGGAKGGSIESFRADGVRADSVWARETSLAGRPRAVRAGAGEPVRSGRGLFDQSAVDDFARAAIREDARLLIARVERAVRCGAALQDVYLELLAGAARRLGEMWRHDDCSFVDVTIGLSKLHLIVYEFMDDCATVTRKSELNPAPETGHAHSALFATPPSEDHSFGLVLVEDAFRRAGWMTASAPGGAIAEIAGMAQGVWFDVFGLGLSCEGHLEQATRLVRQVRCQSRNQHIKVLAGGRVFAEQPSLAAEIGADMTASRPDDAVRIAETVVCLRA